LANPRDGRDPEQGRGPAPLRRGLRSTSPRRRRPLDGYWERSCSNGTSRPDRFILREAGGIVTGIDGHDNALTTGHVLCGNEYVHAELLKS